MAASLAGVPSGRGAHHCPVMAWASQGRSSAWSCRSLESRKRVLDCAASSSGAAGQEGGGLQESIPKPAQGSDVPPPKCLASWREEPGGLHHPLGLTSISSPALDLRGQAQAMGTDSEELFWSIYSYNPPTKPNVSPYITPSIQKALDLQPFPTKAGSAPPGEGDAGRVVPSTS